MSLYTDQFESRNVNEIEKTEEQRKNGSQAVFTDPKINLFGRETIPATIHAENTTFGKKSFNAA